MPQQLSFRNQTAWYRVLPGAATLAVFFLQYLFRFADDNRLTSWQWACTDMNIPASGLVIIAGITIAYALTKVMLPERRPVLFLFFSLYAVSAFFWREPEVIVDVSRYFTQAKYLEVHGIASFLKEWGTNVFIWTDMPLIPFLYGIIFRFAGESRIYIQIFTSFLFAMTGVITYYIGKSLWDEFTGFAGGMLLLGIPYLLIQVPLMLVDVPTMFFLTLSVFAFLKALEKGRANTVYAAVIIFLAVFSKYSTWLMLSVLGVMLAVFLKNPAIRRKTVLRRCAVTAGLTGTFVLIPLFLQWDIFYGQLQLLREYQAPGLKRWGESFLSTFFFQTHPFITLSALIAAAAAIRKMDGKLLIISWMLILAALFQIRRARYILIMFPMLTLMASYGLRGIQSAELKKFIVYCTVVSSLITASFLFLPFLRTLSMVNFQDSGRFLDAMDEAGVEIITLESPAAVVHPAVSVPIQDLYTQKNVYHVPGRKAFSLPEKVKTSPLRFTWEYTIPAFYEIPAQTGTAIAVVSNRAVSRLPDDVRDRLRGYRRTAAFEASSGVFRYRPAVTIFQRDEGKP